MKNMYVYILQCADGSYYTGVTNDIDGRLWEHQNKSSPESYTATRLPVVLVYYAHFYGDPNIAIAFEKQIKGWTRAKKEALIREDWEQLKELAQNSNKKNLIKKQ